MAVSSAISGRSAPKRGRRHDRLPIGGAPTQYTREDLVAYRLSELWYLERERYARAYIYQAKPGLYHVVVKRANGDLEDPSARLGMYDAPDQPLSVIGRALRIAGV